MVGIAYRLHEDALVERNRRMGYRIKVGDKEVVLRPKMESLQIHKALSCIAQIGLGVFNVILNDTRWRGRLRTIPPGNDASTKLVFGAHSRIAESTKMN